MVGAGQGRERRTVVLQGTRLVGERRVLLAVEGAPRHSNGFETCEEGDALESSTTETLVERMPGTDVTETT